MKAVLEIVLAIGKGVLAVVVGGQLLKYITLYGGGVGFAILLIAGLVFLYWFPTTDRIGIGSEDTERKDDLNPLYLKGMFRKNNYKKLDKLFTADLKWDFFADTCGDIDCDVDGIWNIQCVLWL